MERVSSSRWTASAPPPIVPVRDPFLHPHPGDYNVMTRNN